MFTELNFTTYSCFLSNTHFCSTISALSGRCKATRTNLTERGVLWFFKTEVVKQWPQNSNDSKLLKWQFLTYFKSLLSNTLLILTQIFILDLVLPKIIEGKGFQTCTAAHHQGETFEMASFLWIFWQPISLRNVNKEKAARLWVPALQPSLHLLNSCPGIWF